MNTPFAIEITGLTKTYAGGTEALKGVDLTIKQGDFFALLGPNGAGKSTTIGVMTSLVNKTAGQVKIMGVDLSQHPAEAKKYLGVVPQEININVFETCTQTLLNQAAYYGVPRKQAKTKAVELLAQLGLADKANTQVRGLSGGMKRRLMIARALIHDPQILILDEPTAGVDIEVRKTMWEFVVELNKKGTTVILTTHYLEEAENLCKNIAIIDNGVVLKNTSIKRLLNSLDREIMVFYLAQPLDKTPDLGAFPCTLVDADTLEVELKKGQTISDVFVHLCQHNIAVTSVRNKANRLEMLFMDIVQNKRKSS